MNKSERDRLRFNSKVNKDPSGCWLWKGDVIASGYGRFSLNGRLWLAHRAALVLDGVEVPSDKQVMHTCDVRHCVNPEHLRMGTNAENVADMRNKGRGRVAVLHGSASLLAVLTEREARAVFLLASNRVNHALLAKSFGVSVATIGRIATRQRYVRDGIEIRALDRPPPAE